MGLGIVQPKPKGPLRSSRVVAIGAPGPLGHVKIEHVELGSRPASLRVPGQGGLTPSIARERAHARGLIVAVKERVRDRERAVKARVARRDQREIGRGEEVGREGDDAAVIEDEGEWLLERE